MKFFLSHQFDERDGTLSRGSSAIPITRKAADLLRCLMARPGSIVPHDAILRRVWPDAHVQPDNVKVLVRELRRALGDDSRAPRYIRSEPGRGYAFIAPLSEAEAAGGAQAAAMHGSRRDELVALADALAAASRGECRIVAIEGERGMGRTALCEAFLRYVATMPAVRACYGQCLHRGASAEPYFPILDALHHLTRQFPDEIDPLLARRAPAWHASVGGWMRGTPAAAAQIPEPLRMIRELSALLEALATDATTVIVLDDLQWGDAETIDLLHALVRRRAPLRTLFIVTRRIPPPSRGTGWFEDATSALWPPDRCTRVTLEAFAESGVRAYLDARFGPEIAASHARAVHRLTFGHPLVLVSAVDAMVRGGTFWQDAAGWHAGAPSLVGSGVWPRAVLDALVWRFAQLGTDERALLECAASGKSAFTAHDIARRTHRAAAPVERTLDDLAASRFIERLPDGGAVPAFALLHPLHVQALLRHAELPQFPLLRCG